MLRTEAWPMAFMTAKVLPVSLIAVVPKVCRLR